jgi:branched-chain amino acid transport system ATP-binding protein
VSEPLLETVGLTRRFGALAAVDGVSLAFEQGRVHAVIGPNGAGKSTLLNLLSGELRATGGEIRLRGEDVTRATPDRLSRMGIGRSYQTANLFPGMSCADCVWLAAQSRLGSSMLFFRPAERYAEVGVRARRALEAAGLTERSATIAGQLSYGEQRQLEIAMMLATEPTLLLLDEPLAGLGHDEALRVMDLLRNVARGRTVVLVEHDMDAVFSVSDTVTVLVDGRVLVTGAPAEIRKSAAVREAYLGEEIA